MGVPLNVYSCCPIRLFALNCKLNTDNNANRKRLLNSKLSNVFQMIKNSMQEKRQTIQEVNTIYAPKHIYIYRHIHNMNYLDAYAILMYILI